MRRRRMVVAACAIGLFVVAPTAQADAPAHIVSSTGGLIASGSVWFEDMVLPDGSSLDFNVTLVVPQGETRSVTTRDNVDFTRPWVHLNVWKHDNVNHTANEICSTVANPGSWSAGALNPKHAFTDNYGGTTTTHAPAWEGVRVDVRCNDGSGYKFYRVTWPVDRWSWLTTNPVAVLWAVSPAMTWSASSAQGTVTLSPTAYSTHPLRVCGHRANGSVTCYGGRGRVVPLIDDMVTTARPFGARVPFVP